MLIFEAVPRSPNPIMAALGVVSVVALAVVLERACAWLLLKMRVRRPETLLDLARGGAHDATVRHEAARLSRRNPYARVLLQWVNSGGHRGGVEQAVTGEEQLLDRNLWMLECAATIGPLLGILGTLVGISKSFRGFGTITKLDPAIVSRGISLALQTTVVGLVVAIAAFVAAHFFRRLARRTVADLEDFGESLLGLRER